MMEKLREQFARDIRLKGYAVSTVKSYVDAVDQFLCEKEIKDPHQVEVEDILNYQFELLEKRKFVPSTINVKIAALRFFYITTLKKNWNPKAFPFVRRRRRVPVILSLEEVTRLLMAIDNLKHRTLLLAIYAGGLRSNEAVHLKAEDIHSDRLLMHVQHGKGGKSRYTLLPVILIHALRHYWKAWPEETV